jgi:hypothetical protein
MSTQPMIEEIKGIMYADDVDWNWDMQADTLTYTNTGQLHGKIRDALDKAYTLGTQDAIEKVVKDLQTIIDEKHVDNEWRIEEIKSMIFLETQKLTSLKTSLTEQEK